LLLVEQPLTLPRYPVARHLCPGLGDDHFIKISVAWGIQIMKTMICKQLGGACDLELHAHTIGISRSVSNIPPAYCRAMASANADIEYTCRMVEKEV
jgi:hypothetical protein